MPLLKFNVLKCWSSDIAFTAEIECAEDAPASIKLGLAVRWAVQAGADLSGADLSGANLSRAYLSGADLSDANLSGAHLTLANLSRVYYLVDAGQRLDGYRFVGWIKDGILMIKVGCRNFTITDARAHWTKTRGGTPLGDETTAILDHIESVARFRGLTTKAQVAP